MARITTADNIVGGEPKVKLFKILKKNNSSGFYRQQMRVQQLMIQRTFVIKIYLKVNEKFCSKKILLLNVEKQPLLPVFGEAQPTQYQRAERAFDEDEQRELENKKYKYVIGEQRKIFIINVNSSFFGFQLVFKKNLVMVLLNHVHLKMKESLLGKNQLYRRIQFIELKNEFYRNV
jgi:hypothetical protein